MGLDCGGQSYSHGVEVNGPPKNGNSNIVVPNCGYFGMGSGNVLPVLIKKTVVYFFYIFTF